MSKFRQIYLSAGHSTKPGRDRGASGNGFIEGELTADLRNRVANELRLLGHIPICDVNDSILTDTLSWLRNKTTNTCICIDFHWNAATPAAKGTETFVDDKASEFELDLAFDFSDVVHRVLGINKRGNFKGRAGVKSEKESARKSLGWFRFTGMQILPEICFITNKGEMNTYIARRDELAKEIAKFLVEKAKI